MHGWFTAYKNCKNAAQFCKNSEFDYSQALEKNDKLTFAMKNGELKVPANYFCEWVVELDPLEVYRITLGRKLNG